MATTLLPTETFAPPRIEVDRRADGTMLMRSAEPLAPYPRSMAHAFRACAREHPDRVLAGERAPGADEWTLLTWGRARELADAVAQSLLDHGLGPDRPLMVLSGNSLPHLIVTLGAYTAGVPVMPVSAAYSLQSHDHARLRAVAELCSPGMAFADDPDRFGAALDAIDDLVPAEAVGIEQLAAATPGPDVERAFERLCPDSVAKILFTSGSTGAPKGVVNTHRMLCSNQQAMAQVWPFLRSDPPVLVDWLPWSHTFGGNHNLHQVLTFGGALYIDAGKPVPALFEHTVEALRDVAPTIAYNVPAGWALLADRLEADPDLAARFFSRLRLMFYAAAALPQDVHDRLRALADAYADHPVPLTASWGATETAPAATSAHHEDAACGSIGVPLPGVTVKLVPEHDGRHEIRVAGPNVTPGYHNDPDATAAAFDEEGFYRTGDAVALLDPADPAAGLRFDGRLAEDFKLLSGTWVVVGTLRTALLSQSRGLLTDAVIAGHDRGYAAALAWAAGGPAAPDQAALRRGLAEALGRMNRGAGSARRIERILLLAEPPNLDAGEITDKGYVNQRTVLERRAKAVERLFAEPPPEDVILADPS